MSEQPSGWRMSIAACALVVCGLCLSSAASAAAGDAVPAGETDAANNNSVAASGFYDRFIKDRVYIKPGISYLDFGRLESGDLELSNVTFPARLAVGNGPIEGAKAGIDNQYAPTIGLGYYLPGSERHLSVQTIIGQPLDLDVISQPGRLRDESLGPQVQLGESSEGLFPTGIPALGRGLGSVKALPIMLTLLYHPFPESTFRPYIGGGATYLYVYDEEISNDVLTQAGGPGFDVSSTPGYVLQAGIDIGDSSSGWFGFADVRYVGAAQVTGKLSDIRMRVRNPALAGALTALGYDEDIDVGDAKVDIDINPLIYTLGVGYRF